MIRFCVFSFFSFLAFRDRSNKQASSTSARHSARQNSPSKTPAPQRLQNAPKQPLPKQTTPPQPLPKQPTPQQPVPEPPAPEPSQSTPQQSVPKQPAPPLQPAPGSLQPAAHPSQPALQQPTPINRSALAHNRLAGKKIKLGIKPFRVSSTDPKVLLSKLLGPWDPVKSTYEKYDYMMAFIDGGINARVGPPVYGVNLVECTREIQTAMTGILGGRPSEEVTSAIVVALFRVKSHVQKLLQEKDPITGATFMRMWIVHALFNLLVWSRCRRPESRPIFAKDGVLLRKTMHVLPKARGAWEKEGGHETTTRHVE